jgi:hypothetical protein
MEDPAPSAEQARGKKEGERRLVADLPEGSSLRSFDCHASFCRIETSHAGMKQYGQYVQAAFINPSSALWSAPFYSVPLNDDLHGEGPLVMVAYIAQVGHTLPPTE